MTCRDLIIYILENDLEDKPLVDNGTIIMENLGFIPINKVATKMNVGFSTVIAWMQEGTIKGYNINHELYVDATSMQTLLNKK